MNRAHTVEVIEKERLIAIVRLKDHDFISTVLEDLVTAGINVIEITSNTPRYLEAISKALKTYRDTDVLIGAGTITNGDLAKEAVEAGAQFLVTPNTNPEVVKIAHAHEVPVAMGALTASEICAAADCGADIIKFFPAQTFGIDYFKAIQGPLSDKKFFVVGGINLTNFKEWVDAGASGFGLGSSLTKGRYSEEDRNDRITSAKRFIELSRNVQWIN